MPNKGRPPKYPFTELLKEVGDVVVFPYSDHSPMIRQAARNWAKRRGFRVTTYRLKDELLDSLVVKLTETAPF